MISMGLDGLAGGRGADTRYMRPTRRMDARDDSCTRARGAAAGGACCWAPAMSGTVDVAVASRGVTRRVRLPGATTIAALRAALSRSGAAVRLVHMGRLLEDGDRRPLSEWYSDADTLRVVDGGGVGAVSAVAPPCGPEGGGTRVTAAGAGFGPHRSWALRFGSTVVPADVVRVEAHGGPWALCCLAPAHPPGVVSVDALCDGEPCASGAASFTYLSRRQWEVLVEEVAAPSHARNCMQALARSDAGSLPRWSS